MILRYPGGKKKVAKYIAPVLLPCRELREPYFGSGAVTLEALTRPNAPQRVWINDIDPGIASLWTSVVREPRSLVERIEGFVPSVNAFREFKESLLDPSAVLTDVERGFRKLATHQMSYSGLGTKAGSPIGGWSQGPDNPKKYDVGCRWNPKVIAKNIGLMHKRLKGRVHEDRCTSYDALDVIQAPGEGVVIYADPPYVEAGEALYQIGYSNDQQHRDLATALIASPHRWLLSYDDHPLVRELYAGRRVEQASWAYTINSKGGNRGQELLILHGVDLPRMPGQEPDIIGELFGVR